MPLQYILANLLAATPDAVGVSLLDEEGETVEMASVDLAPWDLRMVGAYLGIYLRQARGLLPEEAEDGEGQLHHLDIERREMLLQAAALPDGYYLVLMQKRPAQAARARRVLHRAAAELRAEIFDR